VAVAGGAASCVLIGLACWLTYRESPRPRHPRRAASRTPAATAEAATSSRTPGAATCSRTSGSVSTRALLTRDVLLAAIAGGLLPFAQFALVTYLALYLSQAHGVPLTTGAQLLVAAQLAGVAGRIAWGSASDRLFGSRRRPALMLAGLIAMLGTLLLGWLPRDVPLVWLGLLAVGLGFSAISWQGNWVALVSELAGPAAQGRTVGLSMTLTFLGVAVGPPLVGYLVDRSGSWPLAWTFLAGVLGVGTLLVAAVRERRR
jgi:sugar phosphate permease